MNFLKYQIDIQYHTPDLFKVICEKLVQEGVDLEKVRRTHISEVDEFHVRGAEVSKELVNEIYLQGAKVLDVGCGLGGAARMLAEQFDCHVTGIDLCKEYILTAQKLSELVGLTDKTEFIRANALFLPFADGSFNIVWTQHVQMNIEDKVKFYSEIKRVLNDNGTIVYYDIFTKNGGNIRYPVPWANSAAISFLETVPKLNTILTDLGFVKLQTKDQTPKAKQFLDNKFQKVKTNGLPNLGLNVLMGVSAKKKLVNILKGIEENKIELQSGIYRKNSAVDNIVQEA